MSTSPADRQSGSERSMGSLTDAFLGWAEDDPQAILYDARNMKRATAISRHASEYGYAFKDIACRTRYARWLTRQEVWESGGPQDRFTDQQLDAYFFGDPERDARLIDGEWCKPNGERIEFADIPTVPPADWEPREDDPAWKFCERGDEGAIKVYVCEIA